MIGFWFLDVSSLLFVYMLFNFFCSGQMFPLDILPAPWNTIVKALPLQYMAYFPAAVFLEKMSGQLRCGRGWQCKPPGSCFSSSLAAWRSTAASGGIAPMADKEDVGCEIEDVRRCPSSQRLIA